MQGNFTQTSGNSVTLRGIVKSWAEKKEAERIAWSSPGGVVADKKMRFLLSPRGIIINRRGIFACLTF